MPGDIQREFFCVPLLAAFWNMPPTNNKTIPKMPRYNTAFGIVGVQPFKRNNVGPISKHALATQHRLPRNCCIMH
jgi:hypothetical protein